MSQQEKKEIIDRIVGQEREHLDGTVGRLRTKLSSTRDIISAVCEVLNLRQRYFGRAGEHFSVQDPDGIEIVDTLDEHLLIAIHSLIDEFAGARGIAEAPEEIRNLLTEKAMPSEKRLPPYPVAFMVMFVIREMFEKIESMADQPRDIDREGLENAIVVRMRTLIGGYVHKRITPVLRHFGDVAREYSVISRLKCPACETEHYEVATQTLCADKDGGHYDRIDIACSNCGAQKSISFPLPHFKDIASI